MWSATGILHGGEGAGRGRGRGRGAKAQAAARAGSAAALEEEDLASEETTDEEEDELEVRGLLEWLSGRDLGTAAGVCSPQDALSWRDCANAACRCVFFIAMCCPYRNCCTARSCVVDRNCGTRAQVLMLCRPGRLSQRHHASDPGPRFPSYTRACKCVHVSLCVRTHTMCIFAYTHNVHVRTHAMCPQCCACTDAGAGGCGDGGGRRRHWHQAQLGGCPRWRRHQRRHRRHQAPACCAVCVCAQAVWLGGQSNSIRWTEQRLVF